MINEKELRTGNLYTTIRNQEILVLGIDTVNKFVVTTATNNNLDIVAKNETSIIFEDLNPIELTHTKISQLVIFEEPLSGIKVSSDSEAILTWDEKLKQVVLLDGNKGIIGQDIKYVHQLQNIYFFLTGKELQMP